LFFGYATNLYTELNTVLEYSEIVASQWELPHCTLYLQVKLSPSQAMKTHGVVRHQDSHIL
jgi:hypothetical protein